MDDDTKFAWASSAVMAVAVSAALFAMASCTVHGDDQRAVQNRLDAQLRAAANRQLVAMGKCPQ